MIQQAKGTIEHTPSPTKISERINHSPQTFAKNSFMVFPSLSDTIIQHQRGVIYTKMSTKNKR